MKLHRQLVNAACGMVLIGLTLSPWPASAQTFPQSLVTVGDRQIVPFAEHYTPGEIVVSFGDRRLYHVLERGKAISYPIAVPRSQSLWEGVLPISMKRIDPPWVPTEEMVSENPRLPSYVPGGHPMNPLGVRALYLGQTTYRIHGTDAPWTIGAEVSKGCIRMLNEHVIELYDRTPLGTMVTTTWNRISTPADSRRQSTKPAFDLFRF